jgi:hypothetical protein
MMMIQQLGPGSEDTVKNMMAISRAMMKVSQEMKDVDPTTVKSEDILKVFFGALADKGLD